MFVNRLITSPNTSGRIGESSWMQIAETASTYPIQCGCLAYDVHWLATKRTLFGDTLGPLCDSVRPF